MHIYCVCMHTQINLHACIQMLENVSHLCMYIYVYVCSYPAVIAYFSEHMVLQARELLNQAHTWFLEIAFIQEVGVCVRPPAIKNHSHEMKP